ncbi:Ig-like domain-containing protein [Actinoplanes sp. NPDC051494]|uniref:Ig-like domain-containing protein n=1 Tax=Actinoplanes sp. NPDC051494 TaxID=3363907 RepID=UPI0037B04A77
MPALRTAPHRALAILVVIAVGIAMTFYVSRAQAVITTPFATTFAINTNGAIALRGNANLTCPTAATGCTDALNAVGTGEALNNNNYVMANVGADAGQGIFNSSSATVALSADSTVLFAGLYWSANTTAGTSGAVAPSAADKDKVKFQVPGSATWTTVTSTETNVDPSTSAYQGYADVTSMVTGAGNGSYAVGNIQAGTGKDRYAGWALVIAYRNPALPMRDLRVYDGFGVVSSGSSSVNITVDGFQTPQYGTVTTAIGTVVYEGDLGKNGDVLKLNGTAMTDAKNPADNFFNSTVSEAGASIGSRTPNNLNLLGVDVDQFDASGRLANNATSATLTLTTTNETFYPGVITFSTDLYAPNLTATMTSSDVNGGDLMPGDEIEYVVSVINDGTDDAIESVLTDAIPAGTTYVPGSMKIASTAVTDATGDDTGEFVTDSAQGTGTYRIGTGATSSAGGMLIPNATTTITFRVRVNDSVPTGFTVTNLANVSYTGAHTGRKIAGSSSATGVAVTQPQSDLSAALTVAPGIVQRSSSPAAVTYTVSATNNGPQREPRAVAILTLPAGVTAGTLPAGCVAAGQVVTCQLGALAINTTGTAQIPATVANTAAASAVASATVSGGGNDSSGGNNTVTRTLAVNTAPQVRDDPGRTTNTDQAVTVTVLANDTDADNDPLSSSVATAPGHGTAVANADGTVTYTPAAGWAGTDTFTYLAADGRGGSGTATVTVIVANAAPVATDDTTGTPAATSVTLNPLTNDTDANGDTLSVTAVTQPASGTVTFTATSVTYVPTASFAGVATFGYTVSDGRGGTATGQIRVTVANAAPVAANDVATTDYHTDVVIDVLGNDTDANGDTLGITAAAQPAHGTTVVASGKVTYQPAAGFSGTDTFTYTISDGHGGTGTATVSVTVANARPTVTTTNLTAPTGYGTPVTVDVLATATDPNGDPLGVTGVTAPAHGTVVLDGTGKLVYTPATGYSGPDSFDYTISDGNGGTVTGTVSVTVANGIPVALPDAVTGEANTPVTIAVLANDSDPNNDPLTVTIDQAPAHGTATVGADGTVVYTPVAGFRGGDGFHYTISDGRGGTAGAAVTITVVNSPPTAGPDSGSTPTDTPLTLDVLANDTDPSGDAMTITGFTNGGHGTVALTAGKLVYTPHKGFAGPDTFTYAIEDPAHGTSTAVVTVTVQNAKPIAVPDSALAQPGMTITVKVLANDTDPNIGQTLRVASVSTPAKGIAAVRPDQTISYTADPTSTGTDTFDYEVTDDAGGTDTTTVTIIINSLPIAAADKATAPSGKPVDIDVLANDTDFDGEAIGLVSVTQPKHGTVAIVNGKARYTPEPGYAGADAFTYLVRDASGGQSTGRVSVTVDNADPLAALDQGAVAKGGKTVIAVLANDSDVNPGQQLTVTTIGTPAHGRATLTADGKILYVPDAGYQGSDRFDYTISDGNGGTSTGTVVVTVTGSAPVALPDTRETPYQRSLAIPVLDNDMDPDGDALTVIGVTQPADGTTTFTAGAVTYFPPARWSGKASFTYTISDGTEKSTSTVTVVVGDPPAVPDKAAQAPPATPVTIALPVKDNNDKAVTVVKVGRPAHGTAKLNADGSVTYTPEPGFAGADSFSYSAIDANGNMATGTVKVTVAGPNAAPRATDDTAAVDAGKSVVIKVRDNDKDPNEDPLTVVKVSKPRHGNAVVNADGTITYAPDDAYQGGKDTFTYTISDGQGGTATATVTVTVRQVSTTPTTTEAGFNLPRTGADAMTVGGIGVLTLIVGAALVFFGGTTGQRGPGRHRPGKHSGVNP